MSDALSISWRYVDGVPAATDPALTATFAELSIRVKDDTITRLEDRAGVRDSIFVPLAPIALWVLRSWPALFSERAPAALAAHLTPHEALARAWADLDDENEEDSAVSERELEQWERSHALRMVGDGLALPDLVLRRTAGGIEASWRRWRPNEHTEFLASGSAALGVEAVATELRELVRSVRQRIESVPRWSSLATWIDEELIGPAEPMDAKVKKIGRRYAEGETSIDEAAVLLGCSVPDAIASLEPLGYARSLEQIALSCEERAALYRRLRADRERRHGKPASSCERVNRAVIASERIEGIDARGWLAQTEMSRVEEEQA